MLDSLAERFLEDEALSEGLTDRQAHELVDWLISIAQELGEPAYASQLQPIGREIAKISRDYGVPVEKLIELVEMAWENPPRPECGRDPLPRRAGWGCARKGDPVDESPQAGCR